uniref:Uncharacterized protein n=1 Tax=Rhizophora mucronata TaxID=61149 RepID=A0A2P2P8D4_RHIMU
MSDNEMSHKGYLIQKVNPSIGKTQILYLYREARVHPRD